MAREVVTEAFVLRTVDYGDDHVIVTLLARELGKVAAMARSARKSRKRFGGSLLPLRRVCATMTFRPNRDLASLDSAVVSRDFAGIETSYEKIAIASYATELVRVYLHDADTADDIFDLLEAFYQDLAKAEPELEVLRFVLHHFEFGLLQIAGAAPHLHRCHRCSREVTEMRRLRCGRDGHGLVCDNCVLPGQRYGMLTAETLDVLHYVESPAGRPPDAIADPAVGAQVRRVLDASLELVIDSELKSRPLLDSVMSEETL